MKKKEEEVKKTLIKYFKNAGYKKITIDTNLIENEILDSIGMFELVGFFEKKLKIKISNKKMQAQNFKTIKTILKTIL